MNVTQSVWTEGQGWTPPLPVCRDDRSQCVMVFGATHLIENRQLLRDIRDHYPNAHLLGCSTAGEIRNTQVLDDSLVITAVHFEHTELRAVSKRISGSTDSYRAGVQLAADLSHDRLVHVFALSDGLGVNGSELVKGITANLPEGTRVTGGLAGDADRFQKTLVLDGAEPQEGMVAALGFYSDRLRTGCASLGGWDSFGPE